MITTTFNRCMEVGACSTGLKKARRHLGADYPRDKETSLASLVPVIGVSNILWILGKVENGHENLLVKFAADCATRVLPIFEAAYPNNVNPRKVIEAARSGGDGLIATNATWTAAGRAETEGMYDAARAARSAAYTIRAYLGYDDAITVARAASGDSRAEKVWQENHLITFLKGA